MPYTQSLTNDIIVVYPLTKPSKGTSHFFDIKVMIGNQTYNFIEKIDINN